MIGAVGDPARAFLSLLLARPACWPPAVSPRRRCPRRSRPPVRTNRSTQCVVSHDLLQPHRSPGGYATGAGRWCARPRGDRAPAHSVEGAARRVECYAGSSASRRSQASSQRRQASAQTRQCSCMPACRWHSSPQTRQAAAQAGVGRGAGSSPARSGARAAARLHRRRRRNRGSGGCSGRASGAAARRGRHPRTRCSSRHSRSRLRCTPPGALGRPGPCGGGSAAWPWRDSPYSPA